MFLTLLRDYWLKNPWKEQCISHYKIQINSFKVYTKYAMKIKKSFVFMTEIKPISTLIIGINISVV